MLSLPIETIRSLLTYDPETGEIRSRGRRGKWEAGRLVGGTNAAGYFQVRVEGILFRGHRLAWALHTGKWPENEIDHINGQRADNRFCNLREATRSQNMCNTGVRAQNKTGLKGVSWHKGQQKYVAGFKIHGKRFQVGSFDTAEEARAAFVAAVEKLHGEFFNHG